MNGPGTMADEGAGASRPDLLDTSMRGGVDGVCEVEGGCHGGEESGPLGVATYAPRRLSTEAKRLISREARRAAADGNTRRDACPYIYKSLEGEEWTAVFILAGGKL